MYVKPEVEVIKSEIEDVIAASGGGQGGGVVLPDDPEGF